MTALLPALTTLCYAVGAVCALAALALAVYPGDAPPPQWWQRNELAE